MQERSKHVTLCSLPCVFFACSIRKFYWKSEGESKKQISLYLLNWLPSRFLLGRICVSVLTKLPREGHVCRFSSLSWWLWRYIQEVRIIRIESIEEGEYFFFYFTCITHSPSVGSFYFSPFRFLLPFFSLFLLPCSFLSFASSYFSSFTDDMETYMRIYRPTQITVGGCGCKWRNIHS